MIQSSFFVGGALYFFLRHLVFLIWILCSGRKHFYVFEMYYLITASTIKLDYTGKLIIEAM